ncbi:quinolinate synthase NadA [Rossellomorea marisflavi]|uniref:Quinolinate synthase n=1 Tax=Rossellomorea marisflavi TaxID=189381 RepID=A0A5D4S2X1_9BACI|nr:quinolinate synthase NadA [Rossellomorea marisflavi]TYS56931.1 quinolinate synthase NadA [Rossellomorea marisflavi]WJV20196.1 quinolinate synthase NadA [Rossellomorea marisflavi]
MGILDTLHVSLPPSITSMTTAEMEERVREIKQLMGSRLFIPGHHYQKDEVIQFADAVGDSLQLAQVSAENKEAEYIVFCGVHFMAETADMLTSPEQTVILPDMRAGCSMADMADIFQTEKAWRKLTETFGDGILPLTYVNSTAAIKSFVGKYGGATVTSSNAHKMVEWALREKERILFLPDQHLGRNTAADLGISLDDMAVFNPATNDLVYDGDFENIKVILWKGHCSVHENFTVKNIESVRKHHPDMQVIVHPECRREVVEQSDYNGSTKYIIDMIERAPSGSSWAIGTEMNLVKRLIANHPDKHIISLNPYMCPCLTMNRIDLPHLLWALEHVMADDPVNVIRVEPSVTKEAVRALERMLIRA